MKKIRKTLALLLSVLTLFAMIPSTAFASVTQTSIDTSVTQVSSPQASADASETQTETAVEADAAELQSEPWDGTVDISWYVPGKTEYYISTPAQFAGIAALVNGMVDPTCPKVIGDKSYLVSIPIHNVMLVGAAGGNVSDTVYVSKIDFAYTTFYITADLDMGGKFNGTSWSGPNYTPIGGKYPMIPKEKTGDCLTLDTRFNGVIDGLGHSITNLYCDRYAEKGFPYSMAVGVVGYLGGKNDNADYLTTDFENGWQPAVRNLTLKSGYIKGRRMVGGIVGRVDKTNNGIIIENCSNYASIYNTDSKGIGGIVGSGWGTGVIRNCYNTGYVDTTYACPAGGIVGSNQSLNIYSCYNIGTINSNGNKRGRSIGCHDVGTYEVLDTCYLKGTGDDPDNPAYYLGLTKKVTLDITEMTESELKSEKALNILNKNGDVYVADTAGINNGYPILWYQAGVSGGDCSISVKQATGGTISVEGAKTTATYGSTISLKYTADPGYTLSYFTVNGKAISADYFTATGNSTVSAVFKKLKKVTISIPQNSDYYVSVSRSGYVTKDSGFVYVENEILNTGDTVVEGNVLTIKTYGYKDATPEDLNLEYTEGYINSVPGTTKNNDGTFTVTGTENVNISVTRKTQKKQWINNIDTDWYTRGTKKSVYTITTPEQLAGVAYLVNKSGVTFKNVTIQLGKDISLENTDGTAGQRVWTPIGSTANKSFSGTFDGQGYAIYDLLIDTDTSYASLFGCCTDANIKNVNVYGEIKSSSNSSYAAGIAANMSGGSISGCTNFASVTAQGTHAGGIAAYTSDGAAVSNCYNVADITSKSGAGGIVGVSDSGIDSITSCANYGNISTTGSGTYSTGGIVGKLSGKISKCQNNASVKAVDRYCGGIAGYAAAKNYSAVTDSVNLGNVSSSCTAYNAAVGGIVGYAQFLTIANCTNSGTVSTGSGFTSTYKGGDIGNSGNVKTGTSSGSVPTFTRPQEKTFSKEKKDSYTVTFKADGAVVSQQTFKKTSDKIKEPAVPAKAGFEGYWPDYRLAEKDITINAVYRQILVKGGESIKKDGTYHIAWFSSGEITIADGLNVVLDGSNGGDDGFDSLSIKAGKNVKLTIKDTNIGSETTMLTLGDGCTLTTSGRSEFISRATESGNAQPCIRVSGNLLLNGDGEIYAAAAIRNTSVYVEKAGSVLELRSGTLTVFKENLLGMAGGTIYANGSEILISGGTLRGRTDTDNVSVISADKVTMTSGKLMCQTDHKVKVIDGPVVASGGTICAHSHSPNSTGENKDYDGKACFDSFAGNAAISQFLPFSDVYVTDSYYSAVENCYNKGYFNGTSDTTFSPDVSMTRAMFVTVIYRLAGQPQVRDSGKFVDLTQSWYKKAVYWAVENGITLGTSANTFSPNTPVTREQAAVFLYRFAQKSGVDVTYEEDINLEHGAFSEWAQSEALWALTAGLYTGAKNAMSNPQDYAPRSLLATVLTNYSANIKK